MVSRSGLVICADDLGMCEAVDHGIFAAMEAGTVSQASWMAPGPSAAAAATEARRRGLPCGVHLTFASEWDRVRWRSLSGHPALAAADGNLPLHPDLLCDVPHEVLFEEGCRQITAGLRLLGRVTHFDCHVAPVAEAVLAGLASQFGLLSRNPLPQHRDRELPISRLLSLTELPPCKKADELISFARTCTTGLSIVVCHPAVDGPDLRALCSDKLSGRKKWSLEWRLTDFDALTSSRVRSAVARFVEPIGI